MMDPPRVDAVTADDFRRIALGFRGSVEGTHGDRPVFRVHGRIFATLGHPEAGWAVVNLTPAQQARFMAEHPQCFQPLRGGLGRRGATQVNLFGADSAEARRSLALAHRNVAAARPPAGPRPQPAPADAPARKRRAS
jgi:hypothetical protein